jgi:tRNA U54 and U55 pseudouridine synthase Pus10
MLYYFRDEKKKTIKYYKAEISRHRDITDRPVEEVIEEFENEITKYTLKEGMYGKRQAPFYF